MALRASLTQCIVSVRVSLGILQLQLLFFDVPLLILQAPLRKMPVICCLGSITRWKERNEPKGGNESETEIEIEMSE